MSERFIMPQAAAEFSSTKYTRQALFSGQHLFLGLNCLEPGQVQAEHRHRGADKFYFIVSGRATISVGEERREVGAGELVWAPADLLHGIVEVRERTVIMMGMAPPPKQE